MTNYVKALATGYPDIVFTSTGDVTAYENIVSVNGIPLPSKSELDLQSANQAKSDMWALIKEERDRRKFAGVKVGANWFHSDDSSRIQQLGLVMMGANMPSNIMWKTLSDIFVLMTPTLAAQIFQAMAVSDTVIFGIAEQKKNEMYASADPLVYDYLSGWPLVYGE